MVLCSKTRLGPYEIVSAIGAGEVYRARDPRLNREVAIMMGMSGPCRVLNNVNG